MLSWASCAVRAAGAMAWTGPPVPITIFVVTNIIICFFNENFPGARLLRLPRLLLISNRCVIMHAGNGAGKRADDYVPGGLLGSQLASSSLPRLLQVRARSAKRAATQVLVLGPAQPQSPGTVSRFLRG